MLKNVTNILFLILISFSASAQTVEIRFNVEKQDDGSVIFKYMEISDTSYMEFYYNCSQDYGLQLKQNLKSGTYEVYHNDTLQYSETYFNGKKEGTSNYYVNGILVRSEEYKNGQGNGISKYFNKNGDLKRESYWQDGKKIENSTE